MIFQGTATTGAIIRVIFSILPCTTGYDGTVWVCRRKKQKKKEQKEKKEKEEKEKKGKGVRWNLRTNDITNL